MKKFLMYYWKRDNMLYICGMKGGGVMQGKDSFDRAILRSWRRFNRYGRLYDDVVYMDNDRWQWELPDTQQIRHWMEYFRRIREEGHEAAEAWLKTVDNGE